MANSDWGQWEQDLAQPEYRVLAESYKCRSSWAVRKQNTLLRDETGEKAVCISCLSRRSKGSYIWENIWQAGNDSHTFWSEEAVCHRDWLAQSGQIVPSHNKLAWRVWISSSNIIEGKFLGRVNTLLILCRALHFNQACQQNPDLPSFYCSEKGESEKERAVAVFCRLQILVHCWLWHPFISTKGSRLPVNGCNAIMRLSGMSHQSLWLKRNAVSVPALNWTNFHNQAYLGTRIGQ